MITLKKLFLISGIILAITSFRLKVSAQDVITIDNMSCGIHGSSLSGSKTYYLNELKNRYRLPESNEFDTNISLADLMQSADPNQFNQEKAVTIKGYVFNIKMGGVESCNCKSKDAAMRDTHIEITPDENHTDPQYRIIAEVTPRIRQLMAEKGLDWSTTSLRHLFKGQTVFIKGWLFYDSEHENASFANDPEDAGGAVNWRASCWEIHPVTEIQIADETTILKKETRAPVKKERPESNNATPANDYKPSPQSNAIDTQGNDSFKYILGGLALLVLIIIIVIVYNRSK